MVDRLNVYWGQTLVGGLWQNQTRFVFQYSPTWLKSERKIPLSARLPLQEEPFVGDDPETFFSNLLPEGRIRADIAHMHQFSAGNDFGLLKILGGECAGAISLLPEGMKPDTSGSYKPLPWKDLDASIDQMASHPLLTSQGGVRLSLAGAQQKIPVFLKGKKIFLPQGSYSSSHILKPHIARFENTVENEAFCMKLAKECGLPVAGVEIWKGEKYSVLMVERYDRRDGRRVHQEDFCQALGYSYQRKYEGEGGPKLKDCFALLDAKGSQPLVDKKNIILWTIFNYVTGNCDAHSKNLSWLITEEGFKLAPFYDLLSTVVYPSLDKKLAMKIGGANRLDWISKERWEGMAADADVSPKAVLNYCQEMEEKTSEEARKLADSFIPKYGAAETIEKIVKNISSTCKKLLQAVA